MGSESAWRHSMEALVASRETEVSGPPFLKREDRRASLGASEAAWQSSRDRHHELPWRLISAVATRSCNRLGPTWHPWPATSKPWPATSKLQRFFIFRYLQIRSVVLPIVRHQSSILALTTQGNALTWAERVRGTRLDNAFLWGYPYWSLPEKNPPNLLYL